MKRKLVRMSMLALVAGAVSTQVAQGEIIVWSSVSKIHPNSLGPVMAQQVALASDGNGNVICLYQASQAGIRSISSSTNGTTWNTDFITVHSGNFTNPALATDSQGTWMAMCSEASDTGTSAFFSISTTNGATWSQPTAILDTIFPSNSPGATTDIALTCNNVGIWVAALKTNIDERQVVAIIKSDNNGATWSHVSFVENATSESTVDITTNKNGEFMVVHESTLAGGGADPSDIAFVRLDATGAVLNVSPVGSDAATDTITDKRPRVTSTSDGSWVVSWGSQNMVYVSSSATGATWTPRTALTEAGQVNFNASDLIDPAIACGLNDRLLGVWSSVANPPNQRPMYYSLQLSPQDLSTNTPPGPIDSNWATQPFKFTYAPAVIQAAGGRWVAAWQDLPGTVTPSTTPWFSTGVEDGTQAGDTPTNADLQITKTVYPSTIVAGKKLGYVITVKNLETTVPAHLVKIRDVLPSAFLFDHAVVSQGMWSNAAGTITANIGTLEPGAKATLSIAMTAQGTIGQSISNTATTTLIGSDPNPGNNTSSASTTIVEETTDPEEPENPEEPTTTPSLSLALAKVTVSGKEPKPGKPAKPYSIKVKAAATNISQAITTPTVVMLYLSDDNTLDGADTLIAQKALKAIKPGKGKKANLSAKIAGNPAGKYLIAVIPGEARIVHGLPL